MKFRFLSYNIHRAIGTDRRFRPARIASLLRAEAPEVAVLQEVDRGAPRSRRLDLSVELARLAGFPHSALGLNVELREGHYGNATLSRFPIASHRNLDLTIGRRKRRGCLYSVLRLPDEAPAQRLHVFNLHLGLSAQERQEQAGRLSRLPELVDLDPREPVFVAGDFNDWRSLLRALFVEGLGFRCATDRPTRWGVRALRTFPAFSPRGGLDRIYYRGPIRHLATRRSLRKGARVASDHLPILADFELRTN